eukprot:Hpha_TRINITY_DN22393_c0_g1::TRINITY_DN22393_c0_g1_i1::g.177659::m.177659
MHWLNKHFETVKVHRFAHTNARDDPVEVLLNQQGWTVDTPKPEYVQREFEPTEHCRAWRVQMADGTRSTPELYPYDRPCNMPPESAHPGYCDCIDGSRVDIVQDTIMRRKLLFCEDKCKEAGVKPVVAEGEEDESNEEPEGVVFGSFEGDL